MKYKLNSPLILITNIQPSKLFVMKKTQLFIFSTFCFLLLISSCTKQGEQIAPDIAPDITTAKTNPEIQLGFQDQPSPVCPCNNQVTLSVWADSNPVDQGTATIGAYDPVAQKFSSCRGFAMEYDYNNEFANTTTGNVRGHTSGLVYAVQNSSGLNSFMRFRITASNGTYETGVDDNDKYLSPGELRITTLPYPCSPFGQ